MYTIQATIVKRFERYGSDGYLRNFGSSTITKQVPTFFLNEDVLGIVDAEHAAKIAKTVIDPFDEFETHIHAARIRG